MPLLMPIKYKHAPTIDEQLAQENQAMRQELMALVRHNSLVQHNKDLHAQLQKAYKEIQ